MPPQKTKLLTAVLVLLSTLILIHPVESASKSKVKGTLYALDVQKKTFTVKNGGALTIVPTTTSSAISRNGKSVTLNGLVLGDKVTASFSGSLYPKKVKAKGPSVSTVSGAVQDVSSGAGTLKINGKLIGTKTGTMIVRNGSAASLRSITLKDSATVHMDSSGDAEDVQCEGPDENEVEGTITAVDTVNNTVTIAPQGGTPVTVNVTADTEIEVGDDDDATISALLVGMIVEAKFDPVTFNAFRIEDEEEVELAEIEGIATAVDAVNGTITILDEDGQSVTLTVDASTEIERDGAPAFLADILVGDKVEARFDSTTLIASSLKAESADDGGDDDGDDDGGDD